MFANRAIVLGFIVVIASSVMDLLDSTIAQTAAPAIRRDLGGSYADLEWITAAYTLAMSVSLLLGSRLGDMFGRARVLLMGIGRSPLVEPSILGRRPYVAGLAVVVGFIGAMGGMMIALNVMFQLGLGFSPLACGVATVMIPLAAIAGSITSSALLPRIGRTTMHAGTATMACGLVAAVLVMRSAGGNLTAWDLAAPLALTGFGMGMVFVPMFDVILAGVAPHELGSASGLLESIQQLAMSIGVAAVGTALFDHLGSGHGAAAFVGAAEHGLVVAIVFLIGACGAVCWLPKHAREPQAVPQPA
jgi:MFS family permease